MQISQKIGIVPSIVMIPQLSELGLLLMTAVPNEQWLIPLELGQFEALDPPRLHGAWKTYNTVIPSVLIH
jgi:hypothetical protein